MGLSIPQHVAVIMDGNGRWAKSRQLPRIAGHQQGVLAVRECISAAISQKVKFLTLFGFSAENWKRPVGEIKELMGLLGFYLQHERQLLQEKDIQFRVIGQRDRLTPEIMEQVDILEDVTKNNKKLQLTLALSYGSRQEIVQAIQQIVEQRLQYPSITHPMIDEHMVSQFLWTSGIPDPDLIIRTSGEKRLSNFLLWQSAYAELIFLDVLWPDFSKDDFIKAIHTFQQRQRRYGMINEMES
ncbi:MAG: isoprenyl transferase [Rhodospirillaceae bacterium]|nr:isoprenyl transferase [Rhodospirillaceae bacterium]